MKSIISSALAFALSCLLMVVVVIGAQNVDEMDKTEFSPSAQLVKSPESHPDEHEEDKRGNIRNPYSWQNSKRSKNPYSWMSSFYDSGNANPYPYYNNYVSKKSPAKEFVWVSDYKRTRNPYSWMNFMD